MTSMEFIEFLVKEIHTTVVATVNDDGEPVTTAIDLMDYDENGIYFLTAKGKSFYDRLSSRNAIALTGIKGDDTLSSISISITGKAEEIGSERVSDLIEKNPYMEEIYPTEESRQALTVFRIYEGQGEWFDLSKKPIERESFSFGREEEEPETEGRYFITDGCIGCQTCGTVCPQSCIDFSEIPAVINQENCLHCGNCHDNCPVDAIELR